MSDQSEVVLDEWNLSLEHVLVAVLIGEAPEAVVPLVEAIRHQVLHHQLVPPYNPPLPLLCS